MRQIRNILIIGFSTLFLAGCSIFSSVEKASWPQRVSSAEAAYSTAINLLNQARRPCVEQGPDHELCLIDDNAYRVIDPIVKRANRSLDLAKTLAESGQVDQAEQWLSSAWSDINSIRDFAAAAGVVVDTVRKLKEENE